MTVTLTEVGPRVDSFLFGSVASGAEIHPPLSRPLSSILNDVIAAEVTARLGFIYFAHCGQNVKLLIFGLMRAADRLVINQPAEQTLAQREMGSERRLICKANARAYLS